MQFAGLPYVQPSLLSRPMKKVSKRGGARPNAGRKRRDPDASPRKTVTFRFHPDTIARLDSLSKKLGITRTAVVEQALNNFGERG